MKQKAMTKGIIYIVLIALTQVSVTFSKEFDLQTFLEKAIEHKGIEKRFELQKQKSEMAREEVQSLKVLPDVSLELRGGIVPEARGDVNYSPDEATDLEGWGPFFQSEIKFVQPLYTFGRISNAESGSEFLIKSETAKFEQEKSELKKVLIDLYFSTSAAYKSRIIANEVEAGINKLMEEIEKELEKIESEIDDGDYLEAKSFRYVVDEIVENSKKNKKASKYAVSLASGIELNDSAKIADAIPEFDFELISFKSLWDFAQSNNKQLEQITYGLKAMDHKIEMSNSEKYPLLYLAGGFMFGVAPNRDDQKNPFVYDPFNYLTAGAFVGMKWNMNIFRTDIAKKKDELAKHILTEEQQLLLSQKEAELYDLYLDIEKDYKLLESVERSEKDARAWLTMSFDNWEMGIGEPEKLIKAYKTYFQLKGQRVQKHLDVQKKLTKLSTELGNIELIIKWVQNGKVIL